MKYSQRESLVFNNSFCYVKTLNGEKELFYEKNYARIRVNIDDNLPLNKSLKFSTLTVIIRFIFQEGE